MKYAFLFSVVIFLSSCWKPFGRGDNSSIPPPPQQKVWGNKPVYAAESAAKQIHYNAQKQPIFRAGNIYAYKQYIFQVDIGRGIHVINNADPSKADRIGFITVNGCEQISIKGAYLYTNSYSDLVTIDISSPASLKEISRVPNAFPEFQFNYPFAQPEESGYYQCPGNDSVVVSWVKDSIYTSCYKN